VRITEAATNYALSGPVLAVRRTDAGRATAIAMGRGEGWRAGATEVTSGRRSLPVVTAANT